MKSFVDLTPKFMLRFGLPALLLFHSSSRASSFSASNGPSRIAGRCASVLIRSISSTMEEERHGTKLVRVLALHGSEGTAEEFPTRLEAIRKALLEGHNTRMEITAIEGPFAKGSGFSWWTMKDGERSFTAEKYGGFEESSAAVLRAWADDASSEPYDLVLGHSQGAIMIASLIALGKIPYHPKSGYIFNGVSFPNPYREKIASLKVSDGNSEVAPRILFVMGTNDKITPNETGIELMEAFRTCGLDVSTVKHDGGHGVPRSGDAVSQIAAWVSTN